MALAGGMGVTWRPAAAANPPHAFWFGEDQARYVLAVPMPRGPAAAAAGRRHAGAQHRHRPVAATDLTLPDGVAISLDSCAKRMNAFSRLDGRVRNTLGTTWRWRQRDRSADQGRPAGRAVTIEDLAGDGDHYAATVISEAFRGISRVKQHQIVYAALRGRMGGELHALALQTSAPE
jgi:stress-induced morphogen